MLELILICNLPSPFLFYYEKKCIKLIAPGFVFSVMASQACIIWYRKPITFNGGTLKAEEPIFKPRSTVNCANNF